MRTVDAAGCTVPGCARPHLARGYCRAHYVRWQRHHDVRASVPVARRARGGGLSYSAAHQRVRAARGTPTTQRCAECGAPAALWAYDGSDPDEQTDPARGRRYSLDPARYRARCRSCHRQAVTARHRSPGVQHGLDVVRAARLYRAGASARGIAALLGVGRDAVLTALRAHGVPIRRSGQRR